MMNSSSKAIQDALSRKRSMLTGPRAPRSPMHLVSRVSAPFEKIVEREATLDQSSVPASLHSVLDILNRAEQSKCS